MGGTQGRKIGAQESIRKFCVACMGGSHALVAQCECAECALYAYRHMRQENRRTPLMESKPEGCEASPSLQTGADAEDNTEHLTNTASEVHPSPPSSHTTPAIRAIRRQCLNCCCGDRAQVRACAASPKSQPPFEPCLLWRFRLGSRPEILERRLRKARNTPLMLPGLTMPGKSG